MCYGCWEEAGKPQIDTENIRRMAVLEPSIDHYGNLHILVDDWNVEDSHIAFCRRRVAENPESELLGKASAEEIAIETEFLDLAEKMSEAERLSALALADEFWEVPA